MSAAGFDLSWWKRTCHWRPRSERRVWLIQTNPNDVNHYWTIHLNKLFADPYIFVNFLLYGCRKNHLIHFVWQFYCKHFATHDAFKDWLNTDGESLMRQGIYAFSANNITWFVHTDFHFYVSGDFSVDVFPVDFFACRHFPASGSSLPANSFQHIAHFGPQVYMYAPLPAIINCRWDFQS